MCVGYCKHAVWTLHKAYVLVGVLVLELGVFSLMKEVYNSTQSPMFVLKCI